MRDRRPARCTGPWTWPGPSLSARSPTPTENERLTTDERAFSSTVARFGAFAPFWTSWPDDDVVFHYRRREWSLLGSREKRKRPPSPVAANRQRRSKYIS